MFREEIETLVKQFYWLSDKIININSTKSNRFIKLKK